MKTLQRPCPVALTAVACLCACTVGPDYVRPDLPMPDAWHEQLTEGLATGEASLATWWTVLGDPLLDSLIERAAGGNLDLRIAAARIQEARALRGIATGERYPDLGLGADAQRGQFSESTSPQLGGSTNNLYSVGLGASWEIDVWGRITRSIESADAGLQATVENYRDVLVLLYAEVAINYIDVRTTQERIRFAEANLAAQRDTLGLVQDRFTATLVPELDVRQAELNLAETEALIPTLQIVLAQTINRLGVLLGEHPSALHGELSKDGPIPKQPAAVTIGLPFELLRQRPDIRRAERDLAAQTAQIGVATADLYPRFSLAGSFGFEAFNGNLSNLFSSANRGWSIGFPVQWNLFDGGRIRSNIEAQKALTEQSLAVYQQTVLFALQDVEDSLVAYTHETVRRDALGRAVTAGEQSVALVDTLYRSGLTNFQNVLDMQRSLVVRQDELARSQGDVVKDLVFLYRALGGGWDPAPAEAPAGEPEPQQD